MASPTTRSGAPDARRCCAWWGGNYAATGAEGSVLEKDVERLERSDRRRRRARTHFLIRNEQLVCFQSPLRQSSKNSNFSKTGSKRLLRFCHLNISPR